MKLYKNMMTPGMWVAYGSDIGWVIFPMKPNGWDERRPARGLDPMYLRQVPVQMAAQCGMPVEAPNMPLPHAA